MTDIKRCLKICINQCENIKNYSISKAGLEGSLISEILDTLIFLDENLYNSISLNALSNCLDSLSFLKETVNGSLDYSETQKGYAIHSINMLILELRFLKSWLFEHRKE